MGCKHGLNRRICAVCTKLVRPIVQPHVPVKREVKIPKHNIKSEPTMFIKGSPYVNCGNCGVPTKQFDGDRHIKGYRDRMVKSDIQRKIMVGFVLRKLELTTLDNGEQAFKMVSKLVLQSKPGCQDCYDKQQRFIAESPKGKLVYYKR